MTSILQTIAITSAAWSLAVSRSKMPCHTMTGRMLQRLPSQIQGAEQRPEGAQIELSGQHRHTGCELLI